MAGLVLLVETTHVRHVFAGHMIGFSLIVGETVDVFVDMVSRALIFGRQIGSVHTRFVVNGSVMGSSMIAPCELSWQDLTSTEEILKMDDHAHLIERVMSLRRLRRTRVRSTDWHLGIRQLCQPSRRGGGTHCNFYPVPTCLKQRGAVRCYCIDNTCTIIDLRQHPNV